MIIYYSLTILSVCMETVKNVFSNMYSKDHVQKDRDIYLFNIYMYAGAFAVMAILWFFQPCTLSWGSILLAFIYALTIGGMQTTLLRALRHGPMSYVNFIQTSSFLIPALFGVACLGQSVSVRQLIALPILLISFTLVMDLKKEKADGMWLGDAVSSMICCGLVGVVQSVHQASAWNQEQNSFLTVSFLFVILINAISMMLCPNAKEHKNSSGTQIVLPGLSGVLFCVVNALNLFLIGVMPNVIFFPTVNGGFLITSMLAAVCLFHEPLNCKQWVGILICFISMCMIGL